MTNKSGMFWSGETLTERIEALIEPFDQARVDCAAYRLSIGQDIYITPTGQAVDPESVTVRNLCEDEWFTIPPGQFAFLLTEEVVSVPDDALAFISIRAKIKFKGLVNVSGFHVDPGYRGQLTFSVFNASPVSVHLKRGQEIFLIWYASLDRQTKKKKGLEKSNGLDPDIITDISGELQSFASLNSKINNTENSLGGRIQELEKKLVKFEVIGLILIGIIIAQVVSWLK